MNLRRTLNRFGPTALVVPLALAAAAPARADAPALLPVQGFVTDLDGNPLDVEAMVMLRIYASAGGGTALYAETQSVLFEQGHFTVYVGQNAQPALPLALFRDHSALYLGVKIGDDTEVRFPLATSGFAGFAQFAGEAAPTAHQHAWTDLTQVPADIADGDANTTYRPGTGLLLNQDQFSVDRGAIEGWARGAITATAPLSIANGRVSLRSCAMGQFLSWNGTAWVCTDRTTTSYLGAAPIAVNGNTISLAGAGCSAGQVLKWDGASWGCAADTDTDTRYTGAGAVAVAGTSIDLSTVGCAAGEVWKWSGTAWSCEPDATGSAVYTGAAPIALVGTTITLSSQGCVSGEVWKWNGAVFECVPDDNTVYTAMAPISVSGTAISLSSAGCSAGHALKWTGAAWQCQADIDTDTTYLGGRAVAVNGTTIDLSTVGCVAGEIWKYDGTNWSCEPDNGQVYTAQGPIAINGTAIQLSGAGCNSGQVLKWNGAAWACSDDVVGTGGGTAYTGQAPIGVAGTTISLSAAGCAAGEIWKWNGAAWDCVADANTTYTGTGPIEVMGTSIRISGMGCTAGQVLKWSGTVWQCQADTDTDTMYTGATPVAISGTSIGFSTTGCSAGDGWKWNGTAWSCDPDIGAIYTGSTPIVVSGTEIRLSTAGCTAGEVWKYNGVTWSCEADVDTDTRYGGSLPIDVSGTNITLSTVGCAAGEVWKWNGSAWSCEIDANTTYTGSAPVTVSGTQVGLMACAQSGQVLKWNGTAWACAADTDTTYVGAAPISVLGGAVSLAPCANNEVLKYNGAMMRWDCAADANTAYGAGGGIAVTGTTIALSTSGCVAGEVWKYDGMAFNCVADEVGALGSTYTAAAPLTLSGTVFGLTACPTPNHILKWSGTAWVCMADNDTMYTGTAPVVIAGTAVSLADNGVGSAQIADALELGAAGTARGTLSLHSATGGNDASLTLRNVSNQTTINLNGGNGALTAATLSGDLTCTGCVSASEIATDVITAMQIANNAVGTGEIADNSVTSAKIADGVVGSADLAEQVTFGDGTTAGNVLIQGTGSATTLGMLELRGPGGRQSHLFSGMAGASPYAGILLGSGAATPGLPGLMILTNNAGAESITLRGEGGSISASTFNGDLSCSGCVSGSELATDTITAMQIANNAVGTGEIADNSVTSGKIADGVVGSADLAERVTFGGGTTAGWVTIEGTGTATSTGASPIATILLGSLADEPGLQGHMILTNNAGAESITLAGQGGAISASTFNGDLSCSGCVSGSEIENESITSADIGVSACGSSEVFGSLDAAITFGTTATMRDAAGWTPDSSNLPAAILEGQELLGDSGGIFLSGNTAAIWSPGDTEITVRTGGTGTAVRGTVLALFDEDQLSTTGTRQAEFVFSNQDGTRRLATQTGAYLSVGGVWTNTSDREKKARVTDINPELILERVAGMPIHEWSYLEEEEHVRHIGPMAQDFQGTFGYGYDDRSIPTIDADGVALASVQALHARTEGLKKRNAELEDQVGSLEARIARLERMLEGKVTDPVIQVCHPPLLCAAAQ